MGFGGAVLLTNGSQLATGILLGLGAAVPIGPVNIEIARRVLRFGYRTGVAVGCGAVTVDVCYALLTSVSFTQVLNRPAVLLPISIFGIALLTYLGAMSLRGAWKGTTADPFSEPDGKQVPRALHTAYVTGLLMTLLNPITLAFWFTVVPAQSIKADASAQPALAHAGTADLPMMCMGVFIGTISWVMTFAAVLAWAGRYRKNWWLAAADGIGGVLLLLLAGAALWRLISPHL